MKRFLKTWLFIIPLILSGCIPKKNSTTKIHETSQISYAVEHSYSEILEFKIKWSEVFEIDLQNYYVYFYSKTCSHCQNLKNLVIETALKTRIIFFVEASEEVIIKNYAKPQFCLTSAEIFAISGYPSIAQISNKICIKNVSGEDQILMILNFLNEKYIG